MQDISVTSRFLSSKQKFLLVYACIFFLGSLHAQDQITDFRKDFQYHIFKAIDPIKVDGILNEKTWNEAETGANFWQKSPYFKENANPKTEIKLSYNDDFLYVAAKCYQTEKILIQSLSRDQYWDNDGIAIVLDPLNSKANATLFGTSAVGVQWDATRTETSDVNPNWSNKWYVETQITDEYWSAEFAIPFRILRYDQKQKEWGLNFVRNIMYCNEYHNWTAVPESFWPPNPAFAGALIWDHPPEKKAGNFNLIPYVTSGIIKQNGETKIDLDAGLDAKFALNSSLNLDLTLFPDFSQIEVDELVTNLTRFNISLPEKRTFFLENADLFDDFGTGGARPFFSRRIGLDDKLQPLPILYGARLTGNISKDIRIGIMNIHSQTTDDNFGQNQSAFSLKKQFGRSFIQGMFLNRQAFDGIETIENDYGRNLSVEGLYLSNNGQIATWLGAHRSFKEGYTDKEGMYTAGIQFINPNWEVLSDFVMFQDNFFIDMGFSNRIENYDTERDTIIRLGYASSYSSIDYRIRPKDSKIAQHRFGVEHLMIFNPDWSFNEQYNRLRYFLTLRSSHQFKIRLNYSDLDLLFPFSFTGETSLPTQRYRNVDINFEYDSDIRKALTWDLNVQTGGFYNGRLTKFETNINYRIQPWGNFSIGYQWNDLVFPETYGATTIAAILSKVEIGFSRNLLWTTLFQFVDQSDFMGINSRLQWRFSPMSDLFIVYVDNYDIFETTPGNRNLNSNNRALILKINYWY